MKIFDTLKQNAQEALLNAPKGENTQVILALTSEGAEYTEVIFDALTHEKLDEKKLVGRLEADGNPRISHILCMWHGGSIDLPSFAMRKMLLELNEDNANSDIYVLTDNGYSTVKLSKTIK